MTYPRSRRSLSVPRPRHLASALFLTAVMALTTACASSPSGPSAAPGGSSPDAAGAVAVTVSDIDGTTRTIPDGKPAALFFFSAGCGECVEGADSLNKASTALGSSADYLLVDVDPREPKETINGFREVLLQLGAGAKKAPFLLCDQRYVPVLSGRLEYPANNHCIRIRVTIGKHRALPLPQ